MDEQLLSCQWLGLFLGKVYLRVFDILLNRHRLGDRHCENILLDTNTGDVVHVDFNCLFEKVSFYWYRHLALTNDFRAKRLTPRKEYHLGLLKISSMAWESVVLKVVDGVFTSSYNP